MNFFKSNPSAAVHREWLTLFAIVMGLAVVAVIAVVIGVTGYFRLGGETAALRQVVAEITGQNWRKKVEFNIGSWTTGVAHLGMGSIQMDPQTREVLSGIRSAEAGVYRLAESLDSRNEVKSAS